MERAMRNANTLPSPLRGEGGLRSRSDEGDVGFALIRLALPIVERFLERSFLRLALLLLGCALLMPLVNPWLEYGAEGWLFAAFGLMHRKAIADASVGPLRDFAALFAFAVYAVVEQRDYGFGLPNTPFGLTGKGFQRIKSLRRDGLTGLQATCTLQLIACIIQKRASLIKLC